ncbi:2-(3-amino-3-carboxypropyl)histidine synthase subunit 2 [Anopheles ziemanni]|uniref:2-(3-amino-3-carboxypropyl)histidine synthase subunit 2 n=1 Tax=Anopheles coustani TaxID=139045 RepID=UPI00265876E3|nr:2-(3-amino-3-carboxypropyl)histidine synthase subunit 2 [Anopheles coustani]XP_058175978.1 2-(3-amino-3-carboxypropyl)histidine synthase subunit 2 [Anopheles ziemanni]
MTSAFSSSDSIKENQCVVAVNDSILFEEIWNDEQTERCLHWIEDNGFGRVALQFPDQLIRYSVQIADELQRSTREGVRIYVLGDTSYGSCCVDEIAASHANADSIIHFGHACLSRVVRIPTFYVFYQFPLDEAHLFGVLAHVFSDGNTRFTCFYDVGYLHAVTKVKDKLIQRFPQAKVATLASPHEKPDVLCWKFEQPHASDCPAIYIGKDNLSFFNTTVAIETLQWYLYDPSSNDPTLEQTSAIGAKWIRRRNYAIEKCKDATAIGIVVATLSTAGYLEIVTRIQRLAKARAVRSYIISIGKVNPEKLANFIDIDCFVLVGCPENDTFTSRDFYRPLLSVFEAEMALNPTWREKLCLHYTTNFTELLPEGRLFSDVEEISYAEVDNDAPDVSLITGKARGAVRNFKVEPSSTSQELVGKGNNQLAHISSADHFANRSWQGLEPNLGNDKPALIEEGRSGIPIRYENDP